MEITGKKMMMFVMMVAVVVTISHAQQSVICGMSREELMACRPSATPPNPTTPSPTCCTGLSHADGNCLCSFRNLTIIQQLHIDPDLALTLPGKCGLPPAPRCD